MSWLRAGNGKLKLRARSSPPHSPAPVWDQVSTVFVLGLKMSTAERGETLGRLQKVRTDVEKLIATSINVLFTSLVGIVFVMI